MLSRMTKASHDMGAALRSGSGHRVHCDRVEQAPGDGVNYKLTLRSRFLVSWLSAFLRYIETQSSKTSRFRRSNAVHESRCSCGQVSSRRSSNRNRHSKCFCAQISAEYDVEGSVTLTADLPVNPVGLCRCAFNASSSSWHRISI